MVEIWDEGERKVRDDEQEEVMRLEELKEEGGDVEDKGYVQWGGAIDSF